jgi:hypothetical protein
LGSWFKKSFTSRYWCYRYYRQGLVHQEHQDTTILNYERIHETRRTDIFQLVETHDTKGDFIPVIPTSNTRNSITVPILNHTLTNSKKDPTNLSFLMNTYRSTYTKINDTPNFVYYQYEYCESKEFLIEVISTYNGNVVAKSETTINFLHNQNDRIYEAMSCA